jgi:septum formation protein
MTRVVLASASLGRRRVLREAGIDPLVVVSGVDEDALIAALGADAVASTVVCALATAKAEDVFSRLPAEVAEDCVVIGCDSMLELDGRLRGKPGSTVAARRQWQSMAGRAGVLLTGHAVNRLHHGSIRREVEAGSTKVHFSNPSSEELNAYLASGEPLGVAGAFTIDGLGGWFVEHIEGDPSNVIGLSLPLLRNMLQRTGLTVSDLWRTNPSGHG